MMKAFPTLLVLHLMAFAFASAVSAQDRPERPYRGLFASDLGPADHSLVASGSLGGGWDNNVIADARGSGSIRQSDLNNAIKGAVGQASGALSYGLRLDRLSVSGTGATSLHYYPSLGSQFLRRYNAGAAAAVQVTRSLSTSLGVSYAPYSLSSFHQFADTPGNRLNVPDLDFASSIEHFVSYSAGVDYNRRLSRRVSLGANYAASLRESSAFERHYRRHAARAGLTFDVGRGLGMRAGYGYQEAEYGSRTVRHHTIDAGVDYGRALSFSRRTTLSFGTGTSATSRPDEAGSRTRLRATGSVGLRHEMGRTWSAGLGYARSVRLDADWADVVSSDGVFSEVGGLLGRRWHLQASARASTGQVGLDRSGSGFNTYYGGASAGYAISRRINLGVNYSYYRHRFEQGVVLPSDFTSHFERHSVRASISMWAPLYQRARR